MPSQGTYRIVGRVEKDELPGDPEDTDKFLESVGYRLIQPQSSEFDAYEIVEYTDEVAADGAGVDRTVVERVARDLEEAGDASDGGVAPEPEWFDRQAENLQWAINR